MLGHTTPRTVAAGGLVVALVVHVWSPSEVLAELAYQAALWGAGAAAWLGRSRTARDTPGRRFATLVAGGITLTAVGDSLWWLLTALGADADVSVADLAWFASYGFLCAALWQMQADQHPRHHRSSLVDLATVAFVSVLIFWRFSVEAMVGDDTAPLAVRLVWAAYPLADALLLALIARVLLTTGLRRLRPSFAAGAVCWLVADVLYLHSPDGMIAQPVMEAGWMIAPALLATAAWPARRQAPEVKQTSRGRVPLLVVAIAPLLVPPAFEFVGDLQGRPDDPWQLLVGTVVLTSLAVVRTGSLLKSVERSSIRMAEAQRAAEQASEAKTLFMSNVSHEFRTPLTTILAATEFVRETDLDPVQADLVARVDRSAMTLQRLVEQILDFSRLEHDTFVLADDTFSLCTVLGVIAEEHAERAAASGLGFTSVCPESIPLVRGDPKRVWQMISGLVDNAVKFTRQGGVTLTAENEPGSTDSSTRFRVRVQDTGIGIPEEDQQGIFDAFTQMDASATREFGGTGLGLALSRRLAEQMGGSLEVESRVGEGSTFILTFELTHAVPAHVAPETRRAAPRLLPEQARPWGASSGSLMGADT